ncbi:amidohydrolase family protein [Pseudonocardia ailaonensis]|uniref:Amidohydrolase family protein n=1 Tax=Pseudonocardia ailaonensis TaxID=367279 RepID=A0ABN2MLT3_9PSEU
MSTEDLSAGIAAVRLVDHHVHGALASTVDRGAFEELITESDRPIPDFMTQMDSQVGFAIRRHCAPLLGLPPHAAPADYFARRAELGEAEVNRLLLGASGVGTYLLDTGFRADAILDVAGMAAASGADAREIVRLESVLETVAARRPSAGEIIAAFREELAASTADAVGTKSIIAYRHGFAFDPERPGPAEVTRAAEAWLAQIDRGGVPRVDSPVLLRFLLWEGVDRGLPLQLHVGYGDPDVDLARCDPLLLTAWLKLVERSGTPVMLLHCYPFHRNAGYLAQVFPHVYFDVGLGINYTGVRSEAVIAESLELAPFAKTLFSSDAWGPAELHLLGAHLWRRGMGKVLGAWVDDGDWSAADALRVATMIGRENALRVYGIRS